MLNWKRWRRKITDGTVTDAKLAAGIDGAKISDGTITSAKFIALMVH